MVKEKIVIYVSGGCVQEVYAKHSNVEVILLDEDNAETEGTEIDLTKETKGLKLIF